MLGFIPDLVTSLFNMIKKAETANVSLVWEDSEVIVKVSIIHKPLQTSLIKEKVKR